METRSKKRAKANSEGQTGKGKKTTSSQRDSAQSPTSDQDKEVRTEVRRKVSISSKAASQQQETPTSSKKQPRRSQRHLAKEEAESKEKTSALGGNGDGEKVFEIQTETDMSNRDDNDDRDEHDLLRSLVRGIDPGLEHLFPMGSNVYKALLEGLEDGKDESTQVNALSQLCESLVYGAEERMSGLPVEAFVPSLVRLMQSSQNPTVLELAARALTQFCETLPTSCGAIVRSGAVPLFCNFLMAIEYMDVAEQSLQALSKLSEDFSADCLKAGGLMAVLCFIDFFPTSIQREAVSTAAKMCRGMRADYVDMALETVPNLRNLLLSKDQKIVEPACLCLSRIVSAMEGSKPLLDRFSGMDILPQITVVISTGYGTSSTGLLSPAVFSGLIRLLATCAKGSPAAAECLFHVGIGSIVRDILCGACPSASRSFSLDQSSENVSDAVALVNDLLPDVPARPEHARLRTDVDSMELSPLEEVFRREPGLLLNFATELFPSLQQVFSFGVDMAVKLSCVKVIRKFIALMSVSDLIPLMEASSSCSFLVEVISSEDRDCVMCGLQIADSLLTMDPAAFGASFSREGVFDSVKQLYMDPYDSEAGTKSRGSLLSPELAGKGKVSKRIFEMAKRLVDRQGSDLALCSAPRSAQRLSSVSSDLRRMKPGDPDCEDLVSQLLSILAAKDKLSTFEFVNSKAVEALLHYLSDFSAEGASPEGLLPAVQERILAVAASFTAGHAGSAQQLSALVQKLQDAVSSLERYPVSAHPVSGGLPALSHPLHVRFMKDPAEDADLHDFSGVVLQLSPFETVDSFEVAFWPRLVAQDVHKLSSLSNQLASSSRQDGAGDSSSGEPSGARAALIKLIRERALGKQSEDAEADLGLASLRGYFSARQAADEDENEEVDEEDDEEDDDEEEDAEEEPDDSKQADALEKGLSRLTRMSALRASSGGVRSHDSLRSKAPKGPRLVYSMGGELLDRSFCFLEAIFHHSPRHKQAQGMKEDPLKWLQKVRTETHVVTYRRETPADVSPARKPALSQTSFGYQSLAEAALTRRIPGYPASSEEDRAYNSLLLLNILAEMSRQAPLLAAEHAVLQFEQGVSASLDSVGSVSVPKSLPLRAEQLVSVKLLPKLSSQLQDAFALCTRSLPSWCLQLCSACPFLVPFSLRRHLFQCTALGPVRAMQRVALLQSSASSSGTAAGSEQDSREGSGSGRRAHLLQLSRRKAQVDRTLVLTHGTHLLEKYAHRRELLEFEFRGEEGSGLGPTLEFYTLLSQELQGEGLGMWRLSAAQGALLFPQPWSPADEGEARQQALRHFLLLGRAMGKVLMDSRLLDLPLSPCFYSLLQGRSLGLYDVRAVDAHLGLSLERMHAVALRQRRIVAEEEMDESRMERRLREECLLDGVPVEELCLDFTLPGYPRYALQQGGEGVLVGLHNLEQYVELVVQATVQEGVQEQVEWCRRGFSEVVPVDSLRLFSACELDELFCGKKELDWTREHLAESIKFDHGYTANSDSVVHLVGVLSELSAEEQRAFIQFVTGAPRLPVGGLPALSPPLTIVRKSPAGSGQAAQEESDASLPSVMTCTNYLKLPPYSSKAVLKERLLYAIREGQGAFHFS